LLALTAPRVHAVNAYMYRQLELDVALLKRSNAVLRKSVRGGRQVTRDELQNALRSAGIAASGLRLGCILMAAELDGIICSGARRGKEFTYALLDERAPNAKILKREEALAELARRYFESRGPATVHDFAKWSGLTVSDAQRGLEAVKGQLEHEMVCNQAYWFPTSRLPKKDALPMIHLLSIYDEYVSSYKDRTAIGDAGIAARLKAMGNDLTYIIVVNGQIVGTWKRTLHKNALVIRTNRFRQLTKPENRALNLAAQRYGEFLELEEVTMV
jgi:hypothetical protein